MLPTFLLIGWSMEVAVGAQATLLFQEVTHSLMTVETQKWENSGCLWNYNVPENGPRYPRRKNKFLILNI